MSKVPRDPHRRRLLKLDAEFRAWVQRQPSCFSARFNEYVDGEGRCVAAHIRRSATSGIAYKPLFAAVPLLQSEHLLQHQAGESALAAPEWFETRAGEYLRRWLATLSVEDAEMVRAEIEK